RGEVVLARGDRLLLLLRRPRPLLAPPRHRLEGRREVGQLLDALANDLEVSSRLRPARRRQVPRAPLVEVHADRANRRVEQPALGAAAPCEWLAHLSSLSQRHSRRVLSPRTSRPRRPGLSPQSPRRATR